jgi:hypothetical protein
MSKKRNINQAHGCSCLGLAKVIRKFLLLDTSYGLSDDEALWPTLASWGCFQPRRLRPPETPGRLYYPSEYSHVFEKYWDYWPDLSESPDFVSETPFSQECMTRFLSALLTMDLRGFQSLVAAEAKQSDIETEEDAAISGRRPIQDGLDPWADKSSPGTGSGAPAPA